MTTKDKANTGGTADNPDTDKGTQQPTVKAGDVGRIPGVNALVTVSRVENHPHHDGDQAGDHDVVYAINPDTGGLVSVPAASFLPESTFPQSTDPGY